MAARNTAVFGIYPARAAFKEAIEQLRAAGFRNTDVSVVFTEHQGSKDLAHDKATKAPQGSSAGGLTGGAPEWLTGIGALTIPGLAPLVIAGPLVAALAGAGAPGAAGGMVGALAGLGIPQYGAKRYEGRVREGGVLLSIHCDSEDWIKRAKKLLRDTGAQDIASAGEVKGDFANTHQPLPRIRGAGGGAPADDEFYEDDTKIR